MKFVILIPTLGSKIENRIKIRKIKFIIYNSNINLIYNTWVQK